MKKDQKKQQPSSHLKRKTIAKENNDFPAYPDYPPDEDIFNKEKEVDLNPEDISKVVKVNEKLGKRNEKDFKEDMTGGDLDIPSELDEDLENAGSEDEENNYYSLGGDDHNDLEEDKGD